MLHNNKEISIKINGNIFNRTNEAPSQQQKQSEQPNKQIKNYTLVSLLPAHSVSSVGEIFHFPKPLWMQFFSERMPQNLNSDWRYSVSILSKKNSSSWSLIRMLIDKWKVKGILGFFLWIKKRFILFLSIDRYSALVCTISPI